MTGMSQGSIILTALLCGGDYDMVWLLLLSDILLPLNQGLHGCGIKIATELAWSFLGDELLAAFTDKTRNQFETFIDDWRQRLRNILLDGSLGRRYPALAERVTTAFPNLRVLALYAVPVTSESKDLEFNPYSWVPRDPDLKRLAQLCDTWFGWRRDNKLLPNFRGHIWEGVCIRGLIKVSRFFPSIM